MLARRFRSTLVRILLFPVMPCLQWGAFTHPHINAEVLERCTRDREKTGCRVLLRAVERHSNAYIFAANSPDAISTNHVLRNRITYDYAHNSIPDDPSGVPFFGYRMVGEALRRLRAAKGRDDATKRERELAVACGWLSHQLADRVPHYESVPSRWPVRDGEETPEFLGYANSHQILTPQFYPDILALKVTVEHGLVELFHDAYVIINDKENRFRPGANYCELPTEDAGNIVTTVSESFGNAGLCRIPESHLPSLKRDFDTVIRGLDSAIILLRHLQPKFDSIVRDFVEDDRLKHVEQSIQDVISGLFALTEDEILDRGAADPEFTPRDTGMEVVAHKKESLLQQWGFELGKVLQPKLVMQACKKGAIISIPYRLFGVLRGEVRCDAVERFKDSLLDAAQSLSGRAEASNALARFAAKLLSDEPDPFNAAREEYCRGLRPIARIDHIPDTPGVFDEDSALENMIENGCIKVRFTPARRLDKSGEEYLLNRDSMAIQINGYRQDTPGAPFTVEKTYFEGDILHCEISLCTRVEHVFADIDDNQDPPCHSDYIDKQLRIRMA